MDGYGVNFAPTGQAGGDQTKPPTEPLQQAIQMLSLRLPKVVGAQGIAPGPLMNSPGGSPIMELLRMLFGQGHQGMGQPGMPTGAPMPNVHPGAGGGGQDFPAPSPGGFRSGPSGTDPYAPPGPKQPSTPRGPDFFPGPSSPMPQAPMPQAPMPSPNAGSQRDWLGSFGKNY